MHPSKATRVSEKKGENRAKAIRVFEKQGLEFEKQGAYQTARKGLARLKNKGRTANRRTRVFEQAAIRRKGTIRVF